jgi:hypothetical protein
MKLCVLFNLLFFLTSLSGLSGGHPNPAVAPLPFQAHAHNDYQHSHPLWDALHCGFTSIEVDVHFDGGVFSVAHDEEDIQSGQTLCSMYLDPLQGIVKTNNGHVYQDGTGIILLVDVKSDGSDSWVALQALLGAYEDMLSPLNSEERAPVTILVSGNRDLDGMASTDNPWAQYDGRLDDLKGNPDLSIISLISADWTEEFSWSGHGIMRKSELDKLGRLIDSAHAQGRQVRFWGTDVSDTDDQKRLWEFLLSAEVDFIGTDKLENFRSFCNALPRPAMLPGPGN